MLCVFVGELMEVKASVVPVSNRDDFPNSAKEHESASSLQPLVLTGVTTVTVGMVIWIVGLITTAVFYTQLQNSGRGDWPWIALAGVFLGALGRIFALRRAKRLGITERE